MKTKVFWGLAMAVSTLGAALSLPVSAAEPSPVAAAFGNTVISSYPDGRHQLLWLQADGTWSGVARNGSSLAGRWSLDDAGKVCLKQTQPPTLPIAYCTRIPATAQIGTTWDSKDFIGRRITLRLAAGVQQGPDYAAAQLPTTTR